MKNINKYLNEISKFYYVLLSLIIAQAIYIVVIKRFIEPNNEYISSVFEQGNLIQKILFVPFVLAIFVIFIWLLTLLVKLILCMRKAIQSKNVFDLATAKIINRYVVINISGWCLAMLASVVFHNIDYFQYKIDIVNEIDFFASMVIYLIFAQVIRIGYILKQEQELTI